MRDVRRRILTLIALAAVAPGLASADDRFTFNLVLEGRLLTTPPATSFFEGGLGKTRYGHEPRAVQALSLIHI